jgi:DNA topoisomerase-3
MQYRRPYPLTTVTLQKLAASKLHLSAEQTMNIAERLYQNGFLSYPRTETDVFPPGTDFNSLFQIQTQNPNWGAFAQGFDQTMI